MQCVKCAAPAVMTVPLRFFGSTDASEQLHTNCWRCLLCGTYTDLTILRNRQAQASVSGT